MLPEIVSRLNAEMAKAITAPDTRAKLDAADLAGIDGEANLVTGLRPLSKDAGATG